MTSIKVIRRRIAINSVNNNPSKQKQCGHRRQKSLFIGKDRAEKLNQRELQIKLCYSESQQFTVGWGSGDTPTRNLLGEIMQRWNEKLQRTLRERERERERVYLGITLDELIKNLKGQAVKGF